MDIKEYSYVLSVVENGSISEAAKALYISQPALSIYLRNLEERIGGKLFYKSGGTLYLTDIGKRYYECAKKIVALDRTLERDLLELKNRESGEVVLGVPATRGVRFLYQVLPVFRDQYPGIRVKIQEGTSVRIEAMAHDRQVDIAVLHYPFKEYQLDYTVLGKEEIGVIIPQDNPVCEKGQSRPDCSFPWMDMSELRSEEFILFRKGQRMRQAADYIFETAGYEPKILWELSNATSIYRLSSSGMGPTILPLEFCASHGAHGVQMFSVGESPLYYNVVAAYASREQLSYSAQALLQVIQSVYEPGGPY